MTQQEIASCPEIEDYGIEVLCVGWNPVATAVIESVAGNCPEAVGAMSPREAEAFLRRFYRCQKI